MTDTTKAIAALVAAQTQMTAPVKGTVNPFFKSKYASLGEVMAACLPALHSNGFAVFHRGGADDRGEYVECVFAHETGHEFTSRVYLHMVKADMQASGSAQSYARRYSLQGLAGLNAEDDDGNAATREPPFNPAAARDRIKTALLRTADTEGLTEVWQNEADTLAQLKVEKPAMHAELVTVAKERKAAFMAPETTE